MRGRRIVGRIGLVAATAVLVVGGAACSSGDDHDADTTTTTGTQTTTASPTTAADDTSDADDDQDPGAESGDRSRGGAARGNNGGGSGAGGGASPAGFTAAEESYLDWVGQREGMSDEVARSRIDLDYQVCDQVARGKEDHEIIAEIASQVQGPSIAGAAVGGARQFLCPAEGAARPGDGPPASGFSDAEEAYLGWIGQREGMSQTVAQSRVDLGYEVCARLANDEPDHEIIADIDMTVQGPSIAGPAVEGARRYLC